MTAARLLVCAALFAACSKDRASEPTPAKPTPAPSFDAAAAPTAARPKLPPCTADEVARHHADAHDAYAPESYEEPEEHPDLDGDGTPDRVLIAGSGLRNEAHYFLLARGDCYELVGVIQASAMMGAGFYCKSSRTNGLCDLGIARLMIHGETESSTYTFDGTRYVQTGPVHLSEPPRRR